MPSMEITTRIGCPVGCRYCPQPALIKAYRRRSAVLTMNLGIFEACLKKMPADVDVHFSGFGEPWAAPDCTKMVLLAHQKRHRIGVFTTLKGMTTADFKQLEPLPFKSFEIHLPCDEEIENIRIDDDYLKLLNLFMQSDMKIGYHVQGKKLHHRLSDIMRDQKIQVNQPNTRAGNITVPGSSFFKKKKGRIGCMRGLRQNVLLPNGDVVLCCMDYGLKHLLGNLLEQDYDSLFDGPEFKRVSQGMDEEDDDILCRYCDYCIHNLDARAKIFNSCQHAFKKIRDVRDFNDVKQLVRKGWKKIRK